MIRQVIAVVLLWAAAAPADVVLLHNGSLLEGAIERLGDEVVVTAAGGEVRLSSEQVAHVAGSPLAAYEWLRSERRGDPSDARWRLRLAGWAIDNRLWPQAALELLDARQLDPRSPRLALLERRFDELTRTPEPIEPKPRPAASEAGPAQPEPERSAARPRLPEGGVDFFTRRIQPLLRNGCATAGCHRGAEGDAFPLDANWVHGLSDARTTETNLAAALAALDLGDPSRSPLLLAARGPHHGVTPIRGPRRDELLARFASWADAIGRLNAESLEPPEGLGGDSPSEQVGGVPTRRDEAVEPVAYDAPAVTRSTRPARRSGPRDEFDPEVFNQRHRRPQDDQPLTEATPR